MISKITKYPVASIVVFIWIGFVCSISFMEAWLKFRPENVTLPIGLSIGRLIFGALNKVEWVLAIIVTIHIFLRKDKMQFFNLIFFIIPVILLIIQTFVILPALNERVDIILSGQEPLPSLIHFYYLTMEVIKVSCLFIFGITIFKFYEMERPYTFTIPGE
jgi:hypothetical protein